MKEKKVLHLFNQYLPQTENWAYHLIRYTPAIRTLIAAKRYLRYNFYDSDFTFYFHPYGELDRLYESWGSEGMMGRAKQALYRAGKVLFGDMRKGLKTFIQEQKVDVLHAHFADVAWYYHELATKLELPLVISFYGWDYEMLSRMRPEFRHHIPSLFQRAAAIICEGPYGANLLAEKGCPKNKLHVVPLGVEVEQIPFFRRDKPQSALRLLQIASFTEKKGQLTTLMAVKATLPTCPGLRLTFVGGANQPSYKEFIGKEVERLGLAEVVEILDHLDFAALHNFMRDYQVFIHPSRHAANGDCEGGAPIVLLDAQATGMPVISTKHCDIPSEVVDGQTGHLANEQDHIALAGYIRIFYEMPQADYEKMARAARQHVENEFDIKANAVKLGEVYAQLLEA
ncbi:MAG: glycosyltransferase family 4 protein [Cyanothece sp. SIO1E1]|nr:glycosyltransferase family 4 protein [Cyanothece sp. SIO1E1]